MSGKFKEYKGLSLTNVAEDILKFWSENAIFEKSISTREGGKPFVFYEGPPSANGLPGIHHVMGRTIKDIFPRFKTMKGYQVKRKAGWDTHGLPVELKVETELGITKEDIGTKISIEEYNDACRKSVMKYTNVWNNLTERIGYWVDMENPYITYDAKYMETVWWLLKQIYDKGLMYKGYTIQPYSPKAGTGLSSHEINQPGAYQDVTDTTLVAQFKAIKESLPNFLSKLAGDIHFLAWTTTPWTLPSNTALTVGKKIDYVLVKTFNQYTFEPIQVILAKALVAKQFGKKYIAIEEESLLNGYKAGDKKTPFIIINEFKGAAILESRYEQLLPYALPHNNPENAFRVIAGDFVTTEDGTGIVHTAPTFGQDDAKVAKEAKPEVPPMLVLDENDNLVPLVDLQGRFRTEMGEFAGKYVKNEYYEEGQAPERSADVAIAIKLKEENKAFHVEKHVHSYPHCWRTDKPILYYPLDSWFIKVTDVRDKMADLNETINWKPKATGEGRFGNWLKNANDWNLSRSRYWGIPLPIWRSEDGTEAKIMGSVAELKTEITKAIEKGFMDKDPFADFEVGNMDKSNYDKIDLHKNIVDQIVLVSDKGEKLYREADLIDVWFDSGSMPYAQLHYPFENKELIDNKAYYPADFIAEGVDQTRGWFYTMHAIATMVFDSVAYKNVVSNGLVLDKTGKKMSKRLGNAVDAFETLDKFGPDAIRWYMISNANPWDNLKFDISGVDEVRRKFFGTLYNTYSFFALYANLDKFDNSEAPIALNERPEIDRWVLSELNSLIQDVETAFTDYDATKAARLIQYFVTENLSNWFVRLSRRRFWKGEYAQDKISAYQTLFNCLLTVAKLSAPIAPFFADNLYRDLTANTVSEKIESVHLAEFPVADTKLVDKDLERKMQKAQQISSMVLSLRKKESLKVRQPLQRIMIPVLDAQEKTDIEAIAALIKHEVNIKDIELLDDASGILVKNIKPNFKVLGPKFGKNMRFVGQAIAALDNDAINKLEKEGSLQIDINGEKNTITLNEVEITTKDIEGWSVANQGKLTVALDINLSEDLKNEGVARELINRIQNMRKDNGYEVSDKINITLQKDGIVEKAVSAYKDYITSETLALEIVLKDKVKNGTEIVVDEINTQLLIQKT
jgi:isoleucyl-tRNA synthetase